MTSINYLGNIPPWILTSVDTDKLTCEKKSNLCPIKVHEAFIDIIIKYGSYEFMYTDGSKERERVGCAFSHGTTFSTYRLNDNVSICTAELFAIFKCLQYIEMRMIKDVIICCDSQAAIMAIQSDGKETYMTSGIRELYDKLTRRDFDIILLWIPSHMGIPGNEYVDQKAKQALQMGEITEVKVCPNEYYPLVKKAINRKFTEGWEKHNLITWTSLNQIKERCEKWDTSYRDNRRDEVVLARLRIGHTRLTHSYLFDKMDKPICDTCLAPITISHIIVNCQKYSRQRALIRNMCIRYKVQFSLKSLLGNINFELGSAVLQFLKDTDLYDKI